MKGMLIVYVFGGFILGSCYAQPGMKRIKTEKNADSFTDSVGRFPIVDTGQDDFFDNYKMISTPDTMDVFFGQDAAFIGNQPSYSFVNDDIVLDNNTSLMWQKDYQVMTYSDAIKALENFKLGGYSDWRLPTIKEAYSLILFSGIDPSGFRDKDQIDGKPFIDTEFFEFKYGANGERPIDSQMLSSTIYKGTTMGHNQTVFGVNFADGRIKGYPIIDPRGEKKFMVRFVRGNTEYGRNNFEDNENGTISDLSTGLMWSKDDSQMGMTWEEALKWVKKMNKENYLGYSDWRLPNAKEMQSIVDYNCSPQEDDEPAISTLFNTSRIKVEGNQNNFPFYWTSTTHNSVRGGSYAVYVCFGDAFGYFAPPRSNMKKELMDVHGAGAQRSDPKTGDASAFPEGHGPQGDVIRINNYVRIVRDF